MTITLDYLKHQALENPQIGRVSFLTRRDIEILTGVKADTIKKHEAKGLIKRINRAGQPRYDMSEIHAYLVRTKMIGIEQPKMYRTAA